MSHPSQELAEGLVGALVAAGVRDVVYCPGSRSAPLAYALADAERAGTVRVHVRLDERGAAFVAVGLSRAGMLATPGDGTDEGDAFVAGMARTAAGAVAVALVTTSGGAVAELHAGVAEASHSGLPLVVLSADRPFELRGVGASQTTTQPGVFGPHVRASWDVPAGTPADRRLRALVARAVATALGAPTGEPGPVQLDIGFRDPLVPDPADRTAGAGRLVRGDRVAEGGQEAPVDRSVGAGQPVGAGRRVGATEDPVAHSPHVLLPRPVPVPWTEVVDPTLRTVVLAGDGADPEAGTWAGRAGIPLLAEPSSGLTTEPAWVPHQQALVGAGGPGDGVEQVVLTGRPTLSRAVSALLSRPDVRLVVQSRTTSWWDPSGNADVVVPALAAPEHLHDDSGWALLWESASREVGERIRALLDGSGATRPTLVGVAAAVWAAPPVVLMLGASNTVRAVDLVAEAPGREDVVSNRGLAGIDGTIATARGLAWGSGRAVRAVMGDLTFLHDVSSLAVTESERPVDLQVVVIDDHGGSIFAGLEHGRPEYAEDFPHWFGTAQEASIGDLARGYGADYREVTTTEELAGALAAPVRGRSVLHVRVGIDPPALTEMSLPPQVL